MMTTRAPDPPAGCDLTISDTPGDVWSCPFIGCAIAVIAQKIPNAGKMEIQIDGQTRATADLATAGTPLVQQKVCEITGLPAGKHVIRIINRGPGPVDVDAITVK